MIIRNALKTPDGTIIESKHVHDYVEYTDANGEVYFVDGGTNYLRRSANAADCLDLSVTTDSRFEIIRRANTRKRYKYNQIAKYFSFSSTAKGCYC